MKNLPPISFEVFPPKTPEGVETLYQVLAELKTFNPEFISVTYGAMGSTQALTKELVLGIRDRLDLETIPHFTCVGSHRDDILAYLQALKAKGIDRILALRGDPPQGQSHFVKVDGGFTYANELVAFIRETGGFRIAVAGYPEGHIEAPSLEVDLLNLKRKVDAGAERVITQLFLDNDVFFNFVERARKIGITVPIVPGIMPVSNRKQIAKITSMCGAHLPPALLAKLEACNDDAEAMMTVGVDWATAQVKGLIDHGVPGIHFYILNQAKVISQVIQAL